MFYVLVADDEPLTRSFLANTIPALCPDFQVTGIACDGIEAMNLCKKQHFDLVITDIRMPELDGLGLCKYLNESGMDCRLVILSGYNEFEYARTALRYQVSDYILKPINDDMLKDILFSIKEDLEKKERTKNIADTDAFSLKSNYELTCDLLQHILSDNEDAIYPIFSILEDRQFTFIHSYAGIIRVTLDELRLFLLGSKPYDRTTQHLKLLKICKYYCKEHNLPLFYDRHNAIQILIQAESPSQIENSAENVFHDLYKIFQNSALAHFMITCGNAFVDMMDANVSGMIAYRSFALTLIGEKGFISYQKNLDNISFLEALTNSCENLYLIYLRSDSEALEQEAFHYISLFANHNNSALVLGSGNYLIRYICDRSSIKTHYTQSAYQTLLDCVNQMIANQDFSDSAICSVFTKSISRLMITNKSNKASDNNQLAEAAKQYIYAHFNESLSLTSLADVLNVNSCYLSDTIHKNLGESYSKFLLRVRMERAVEIMRTNPNTKIYHIAEKIGFISPKHFISVFKKYYGVTPSVYMENYKH